MRARSSPGAALRQRPGRRRATSARPGTGSARRPSRATRRPSSTSALRYDKGQDLPQDSREGDPVVRRAGAQGHASSQFNLALILRQRPWRAARRSGWRWPGTAGGRAGPRRRPGQPRPALRARPGRRARPAQAAHWYRKAAAQGLPAPSTTSAADRCRHGVEHDPAQAVLWYRKAAEQGHLRAQFDLGAALRGRAGRRTRQARALAWYRRAADQEYAPAQYMVGHAARPRRAACRPAPRPRVVPQGGRPGPCAGPVRARAALRQRPRRRTRLRGRPFLVPVRRAPGACARAVQPGRDVCASGQGARATWWRPMPGCPAIRRCPRG
jgi:hypothetical protein